MGVLEYLMGTPIKYPRTHIKYPTRRRPEADILEGCGGGGAPAQNMFIFESPSGDLKTNMGVGGGRSPPQQCVVLNCLQAI